MPETYTRLTEDERYQIYEGVTEKRSHRELLGYKAPNEVYDAMCLVA
jgi:hypothetical protein